MFLIKKLIFKLMELGLGLNPCFSLQTKNPIFINFALTSQEADAIQKTLPSGFRLEPIAFTEGDVPRFWLSYNLYEIEYPKKELAHLKRVRCEMNTLVKDGTGRAGVYVFCGSPFVSKEEKWGVFQLVADFAERVVIWIYGVGKLLPFQYELSDSSLKVHLEVGPHKLHYEGEISSPSTTKLSEAYIRFNDISFFNQGKTFDRVNTNSEFSLAQFRPLPQNELCRFRVKGPFLSRVPDAVFYHLGSVSYLVSALNKTPAPCFSLSVDPSGNAPCPA